MAVGDLITTVVATRFKPSQLLRLRLRYEQHRRIAIIDDQQVEVTSLSKSPTAIPRAGKSLLKTAPDLSLTFLNLPLMSRTYQWLPVFTFETCISTMSSAVPVARISQDRRRFIVEKLQAPAAQQFACQPDFPAWVQ